LIFFCAAKLFATRNHVSLWIASRRALLLAEPTCFKSGTMALSGQLLVFFTFSPVCGLNWATAELIVFAFFVFLFVRHKKVYSIRLSLMYSGNLVVDVVIKKPFMLNSADALLVTDVQNDFLPGGALPVAGGDEIIPVLNEYMRLFRVAKASVLASRDWHPKKHMSFTAQGGPWPPHCVQKTKGARFSTRLKLPKGITVISKATDPEHESYSVFDRTNFEETLQKLGVNRLFIGGLATDYCIVNTVLDARKLRYPTVVLMDAVRGINVKPHDVENAVAAMLKAGAQQTTTADFPDDAETLPLEVERPDALEKKPALLAAEKKKARLRAKGSGRVKTERKR
jgi:nicotinamidase/pyrazinamidase